MAARRQPTQRAARAERTEHANLNNAIAALTRGGASPIQARRVAQNEIELAIVSANNHDEHRHWSEVRRLFVVPGFDAPAVQPQNGVTQARSRVIDKITGQLEEISNVYSDITVILAQQDNTITTLERNVDSIRVRIDASEDELADAAPRAYRVWRWHNGLVPRTLGAKLRCVLISILMLNCMFVTTVLL